MRKEIGTEIITDPADTKREIRDYLKQICANKLDNIKMDISFAKYNLAKLIYEKQKIFATIKNIHLVIFKSPQKVKINDFMIKKKSLKNMTLTKRSRLVSPVMSHILNLLI